MLYAGLYPGVLKSTFNRHKVYSVDTEGRMEKIGVIGTGYVGLVTGVVFAHWGHKVVCADQDAGKVERLRKGVPPIYEPGLADLLVRSLRDGNIEFTNDVTDTASKSDIIFIAVGTPDKGNGEADVSQVEAAIQSIAGCIDRKKIIVMKSTVPVGTNDWVRSELLRLGVPESRVCVVSNPEFLREGNALYDAMNPDRIVVGGADDDAMRTMSQIYDAAGCRILYTDAKTAELIKYASNCFLAMKVSFINSLSVLCERFGANVTSLADGMGLDGRIGRSFLNAGLGWGGSCFPKDVYGLMRQSEAAGYEFGLLRETITANDLQIDRFVDAVRALAGGLEGKTISLWGLAFKPDTDDIRESRAVHVAQRLIEAGAKVKAFDPAAMDAFSEQFPSVEMCRDAYSCARQSSCVALITEWPVFRQVDLGVVRDTMSNPAIADGRNALDPAHVRGLGFEYWSFGRQ